ncbi:Asparagine synthetase domain-containing protein [Mycena sanguinolenta]|uniref:Asparagine synthetase domain-containing protein n=1 Tax=Mycena sanguinolenta TaxID=230812 RepID=A0A8H7DD41_9AGAR|nr:Asparagine synthetase domain-containing protein [Mycena sanguinolenta]
MCGLISAFYPDGVTVPSAEDLKHGLDASLEIIKHRGPDSTGTYISSDGRVGLGHVRLSIIDLSTGQQPLSDEENLIHCVVTGEIYDHDRIRAEMETQGYSFKTKSDSELVIQLYKRDGFNMMFHLRGEFAFVLYDAKRRLQFAARDRFGIKPLYYTVSNGRILFASEMKAFMGLGWQAEWDVESIIHEGDFADERTVFKRTKKVPPGYFILCRASGDIETQVYWDLSYADAAAAPSTSLDSMISTVRDLLVEAVRLRLRADVPWAVYLSGGIDSSSVAGIATHLLREKDPNAKLTAFTLAYIEDESTDESPLAARTAAHLGADLVKVEATEAKLVGLLEESIWHSEHVNTTFHGAGKLLLSSAVREAGYKVALSGEGSDEIFGGYPWFPLDYLRNADPAAASLGISLPTEAERLAIAEEYQAKTGMVQLPSTAMSLQKSDGPHHLLNVSAHLTVGNMFVGATTLHGTIFRPEIAELVGKQGIVRHIEEAIDPRVRQKSLSGDWHSLNVSLYVIAKTLMAKTILNINGDRNDMANSIESRVAFLDHHFVEYINSLPPSLKIRPIAGDKPGEWSMVEKWILRQAVKEFVTEEVYLRKKVPFNPPPATRPAVSPNQVTLQRHLKARVTQASVEKLGFISWPAIRDVLADYLESPTFPPGGNIDARARVLMSVLSYIVFQERFHVSTYRL